MEAPPSLCHLDRSVPGFPATQNSQRPRMRLSVEKGAQGLPTPTPTTTTGYRGGVQWRELRVDAPSWKFFFDRGVMGLWPTQGDEKRLGPATTLYELSPSPCHPELSRGICSSADLSWKCFSTERSPVERGFFFSGQKKSPLFPRGFSKSQTKTQATLRINLSRNSSGIRSCSTRAWAIATSAR
jgi:hypothetical protein